MSESKPRPKPYVKPPRPQAGEYDPNQQRKRNAHSAMPAAKYHRGARIK